MLSILVIVIIIVLIHNMTISGSDHKKVMPTGKFLATVNGSECRIDLSLTDFLGLLLLIRFSGYHPERPVFIYVLLWQCRGSLPGRVFGFIIVVIGFWCRVMVPSAIAYLLDKMFIDMKACHITVFMSLEDACIERVKIYAVLFDNWSTVGYAWFYP